MKKTGKVLSLVLSLALVASSLTATFASAASARTEYLKTVTDGGTIELVNGKYGNASKTNVTTTITTTRTDGETVADHLAVSGLNLKEVVHKSGSSLVTAKIENGAVNLYLNSDSAVGTEVLAARYATDESFRYTDSTQKIVFTQEVDYTVKVAANNTFTVELHPDTASKSDNDKAVITGTVVKHTATAADNQIDAKTAQLVTDKLDSAVAAEGAYYITVPATAGNTAAVTLGDDNKSFTVKLTKPATASFLNVGSITVYAQPVSTAYVPAVTGETPTPEVIAQIDANKTIVASGKVSNTVELGSTYKYIYQWKGSTWADTAPTAANSETSSEPKPSAAAVNITSSDVVLGGATTMESGNVGAVSGEFLFTLEKGVAASVDVANVIVDNGTIAGAVEASTSVAVNGGTVGNITAPTVTVDATTDKIPTNTGTIAAANVTVGSATSAAGIVTGKITEAGANGLVTTGPAIAPTQEIKLQGTKLAAPVIDLDYYQAKVTLNDYTGTLATPANSGSSSFETLGDTDAILTGNAAFINVTITSGKLTVKNALTADYVGGVGTLVVPAGALAVNKSINTVAVQLSDSKITKGLTVVKAPAYSVYNGSFKTVGYTLDYDAVNSGTKTGLQPYQVKDVTFAGLKIAPVGTDSHKIVQKTSVTYEVTNYPGGTALPDGTKINITFSGSSDNFTTEVKDNKITITATKFDSLFSSLNKGTITATVVNKDTGIKVYGYDDATYDVEVIEKPELSYTSDTHGTYNMLIGQSYTFKITASDGSVPPFVVASNGATVAPYTKAGNDYFFKVTGAKVGDYGVYVGDRVCILHITDVKTDTTKVTVANGKSYVFKITKGENAPAPYFVVAGQGVVLPVDIRGNDYFYKVTNNGKTGDVGVYVNGPKIAVITFTK